MNRPAQTPLPRLDPNKTIWQRLNDQLLAALDDDQVTANQLTVQLHPYVLAERAEGTRAALNSTKKA